MLCSLLKAFKVFFVGNAYYSSSATVHSDKNMSTVAITYNLHHDSLHIDNSITIINDYQYHHCFPQQNHDKYIYLSHDLHLKLKKIDRLASFYHLSNSELYNKYYKKTNINTTKPSTRPHPTTKPSTRPHSTTKPSTQPHSTTKPSSTNAPTTKSTIPPHPIHHLDDIKYKIVSDSTNKKHIIDVSPHLEEKSRVTVNQVHHRHLPSSTPRTTSKPMTESHPTPNSALNHSKKKDQLNNTTSNSLSGHLIYYNSMNNTNTTVSSTIQSLYIHNNTNNTNNSNNTGSTKGSPIHTIIVFAPSRRYIQQSVHNNSSSNTTSLSSNTNRIFSVNHTTSYKAHRYISKHKHDHENDQDYDHSDSDSDSDE